LEEEKEKLIWRGFVRSNDEGLFVVSDVLPSLRNNVAALTTAKT
jgi:hypothetical protein